MVAGSIAASLLPAPKSRIRVICNTLLLSMSTENFILAFGSSAPVWCLGGVLGWIWIPIMNANMDVVLRTHIPVYMQGQGLFRPQHAAVFHHTGGLSAGRRAGGPGV